MDNQNYMQNYIGDISYTSTSLSYQESYDYCRAENYIEREKLDFVLGVSYQKEED